MLRKNDTAALLLEVQARKQARQSGSVVRPELAHHYTILSMFAQGPVDEWDLLVLGHTYVSALEEMLRQKLVSYDAESEVYSLTQLGLTMETIRCLKAA